MYSHRTCRVDTPPRSRRNATRAAGLLLAGALGLGCSKDDHGPTGPPRQPGVIEFPGGAGTLQEAMNRAAPGDTVRVGPGTHAVSATVFLDADHDRIVLTGRTDPSARGESRPILDFDSTVGINVRPETNEITIEGLEIVGNGLLIGVRLDGPGAVLRDVVIRDAAWYSVMCADPAADGTIERCFLLGADFFGVRCDNGSSPLMVRNTILDAGDCGIYSNRATPICEANVIARSANYGVACFGSSRPVLGCNVLFDNARADYTGCAAGEGDRHEDPLFCDEDGFALAPDSPCVPGNSEGCSGWLGASESVCEARR